MLFGRLRMFTVSCRKTGAKLTPSCQLRAACLSLSLLLLAPSLHCPADGKLLDNDDYEPPFPRLDQAARVRLTSETTDAINGYQVVDEYVDLASGRSARVTVNRHGKETKFMEASLDLLYTYKPYSCRVEKISQRQQSRDSVLDLYQHPMTIGQASSELPGVVMHVPGLIGLWLFLGEVPKTFSSMEMIYSSQHETHVSAHSWSYQDPTNDVLVRIYFVPLGEDPDESGKLVYSLEMVKFDTLSTHATIGVINVLAHGFNIDDQTYNLLLREPVGYGCTSGTALLGARPERSQTQVLGYQFNGNIKRMFAGSSSMIFELTATNVAPGQRAPVVDVMGVELAQSKRATPGSDDDNRLFLVRVRHSGADLKTVLDYSSRIGYTIDARLGTCSMDRLDKDDDESPMRARLNFKNGLSLELDSQAWRALFYDDEQFYLVRKDEGQRADKSGPSWFLFERTLDKLGSASSSSKFRVLRRYVAAGSSFELQQVELIKLSTGDSRDGAPADEATEMYQFNVIEMRALASGWPDEPRVFDISEECYLNNERMLAGRDYAWMQFHYPAAGARRQLVLSNELTFKKNFYENHLAAGFASMLRLPRVELLPDAEGFTMRCLILDAPPLELVYERIANESIYLQVSDELTGDTRLYTPDLEHCTRVCRLSYCSVMTYCPAAHSCIVNPNAGREVKQNPFVQCDTYRLLPRAPATEPSESGPSSTSEGSQIAHNQDQHDYHSSSLANLIAKFQHQSYGQFEVPKEPEEILMRETDSGLTSEEYLEAVNEYLYKLTQFLEDYANQLPELSLVFTTSDNLLVMLPDRFKLENDPLDEIDALDTTNSDQADYRLGRSEAAAFHEALQMFKYKPGTGGDSLDHAERQQFKLMGLAYDQCALACLDGKCGSFSYCFDQRECILSAINNTGLARQAHLVEQDSDCVILQRDFLGNFKRFEETRQPELFREKHVSPADVSECAMNCVAQVDYKCLSFDYCRQRAPGPNPDNPATCYYQTERFGTARSVGLLGPNGAVRNEKLQCEHYARSYLADFRQAEHRRLSDEKLTQLEVTVLDKLTLFRCAEMCATEMPNCVAFQFCLSATVEQQSQTPRGALSQECSLVLGKSVSSNGTGASAAADGAGSAAQSLTHEPKCNMYFLRKDSSEAQLRDLASPGLGEFLAVEQATSAAKATTEGRVADAGPSLMLLFSLLTIVSAATWCGLCLAVDRNPLARRYYERSRLYLGCV